MDSLPFLLITSAVLAVIVLLWGSILECLAELNEHQARHH